MTIAQAEVILLDTDVRVALQQRFAFDTGTMLRLDNYAIINIFDDGRYYIQGENVDDLVELFSRIEPPWNPSDWNGEVPRQTTKISADELEEPPKPTYSRFPFPGPNKRFDI